jgi:PAS domain S-box-containing protein
MSPREPARDIDKPGRPDVEAFVALISSLSARLARASADAVTCEVDACLRDLLTFFGVDQCGIIEVQPDIRQGRLRHVAAVEGYPPAPTTIEYGKLFPWTHEKTVIRGESFVQTCIDDLPPDAVVDRRSAAGMQIDCLVTIPAGIGGRVTHVLCLTNRRPIASWPAPILAMLKTIAETLLAVLTRHNTELALRRSERSLSEAQRIAGVGSYVCDWRDDTLTASDEANNICGVPLTGAAADVLARVHPEDRQRLDNALRATVVHTEPTHDVEYRIVRPDGSVRTLRSSVEMTRTADGSPLRTVATIQDVSALRAAEHESRRLRAELRHADRAAHLGALTASLSHELNQPLTGILANAQAGLQGLRRGLDTAQMSEILDAIVRDDKRAAAVVANLRMLLRREEAPRTTFDLAEAVAEVLMLFRSEFEARDVRVEPRLHAGCTAFAERTQIQQVFVNLLANAMYALEEVPIGERTLDVSVARASDDTAHIVVRDGGCGIPAERLDRIFEPFFTTRSDGLGMGLAISRSIVEAHGGDIDVQNNAGGGATFSVSLPVQAAQPIANAEHSDEASVESSRAPIGGAATVCIVDDDVAVRDGVARLVAGAGLGVLCFDSASAALESGAMRKAHCLLLDVQMPGMSGLELHDELVRRGIDAPVIFLTARADAATGVEAMKGGAIEYLTKPVDEAVLIAAVSQGLDRHAQRTRDARERGTIGSRVATLTPRERDVLRCVIGGRMNKQIAADLSISEATVKQHRGQVMEKMRVRSVAELVRMCEAIGFATNR